VIAALRAVKEGQRDDVGDGADIDDSDRDLDNGECLCTWSGFKQVGSEASLALKLWSILVRNNASNASACRHSDCVVVWACQCMQALGLRGCVGLPMHASPRTAWLCGPGNACKHSGCVVVWVWQYMQALGLRGCVGLASRPKVAVTSAAALFLVGFGRGFGFGVRPPG
jgi:hypothetical protein